MSGGSWGYFCYQADEVANLLCDEKSPLRRAFGKHMKLIAHAMHEIEWVDSADKGSPDDINAIKAVFEDLAESKEMEVLFSDAREAIDALIALRSQLVTTTSEQ